MSLESAQEKFTQLWGTLGSEWGINRTMAQIHALLLLSEEARSTDQVMEELGISRGNANMNLRELVSWGLVQREIKSGERKDYFVAEKDIWEISRRIVAERKKRELDPMMRGIEELLSEVKQLSSKDAETKHFKQLLESIHSLGKKSSLLLNLVLKLDQSAFFKPLGKLLK